MEIKKVFNNNVVLTENKHSQEMVVMGRGLAFKKRPGDPINPDKVEKTFVLENQGVSDKLAELLSEIPEEYFDLSYQIIDYAKTRLPYKLDDYIYVALTDHLSFAISRYKQGIHLPNALLWEIRKYYKQEFQVAMASLDIIEKSIGVRLEEDEAGSIALHLVNSQLSGESMEATVKMTKMVNNILNIVKYYFQIELDESSINYERFLIHLRFFALRSVREEKAPVEHSDDFLYEQVKKKYHKAFLCSEKVAAFVETNYDWHVTKDEIIYLTLHIHRVTNRHDMNADPSD
ncbi:PRD domain-containing protein [Sediminibacillus dalangtanensis]|uniref:PRD domain-containing protein n=1 Tax=Sediminibacillus dalangtanensis TaxID=2729421 RepID=A0ABX7VPL0_9BACI|nr:PRD domain-containing protein [Sediminibacillus dalangtanensis]QTM98826.1 PRD domain-containing protein [Sediminibacillus dalangtanensis]